MPAGKDAMHQNFCRHAIEDRKIWCIFYAAGKEKALYKYGIADRSNRNISSQKERMTAPAGVVLLVDAR